MRIISSADAAVHALPNKYSNDKELLFPAHGISSSLLFSNYSGPLCKNNGLSCLHVRNIVFCTVVLNSYFIHKLKKNLGSLPKFFFVRMVGLEPTRGHPRKILSLVRLPFRHIRMCEMFASQQSISYHPLSILSIPFLNFFTKKLSASNSRYFYIAFWARHLHFLILILHIHTPSLHFLSIFYCRIANY